MHLTRQPGLLILEHSAPPSRVVRALQGLCTVSSLGLYIYISVWAALLALLPALILVPNRVEKVIAVDNMGLQIERKGILRYFNSVQLFIPASKILDIVINEVFVTFEVVHVLEAIVKDDDRLTIIFENRLDLEELETAWRALQGVFGEK